jgi:hypothetical protein
MGLTEILHHSMEWIAQSGWIGVAGFIVLYTLTCILSAWFGAYDWGGRGLRFLVQHGSGDHQLNRRGRGQFSYQPVSGEKLDAATAGSQCKIPRFGQGCQHGRLADDPYQPHVADYSA